MEVLYGQIVIVLNNCSSTTGLYVLTGSVSNFKIFGLNRASIAIKIISPESLCIALSKYVASPREPFSADFCIEANGSHEIF